MTKLLMLFAMFALAACAKGARHTVPILATLIALPAHAGFEFGWQVIANDNPSYAYVVVAGSRTAQVKVFDGRQPIVDGKMVFTFPFSDLALPVTATEVCAAVRAYYIPDESKTAALSPIICVTTDQVSPEIITGVSLREIK